MAFWAPLSMLKGRLGYKICTSAIKNGKIGKKKEVREAADEIAFQSQSAQRTEKGNAETAPNNRESQTDLDFETDLTRAQLKEFYAVLKKHIKQHGHFTMLEAFSPEQNTRVVIRV